MVTDDTSTALTTSNGDYRVDVAVHVLGEVNMEALTAAFESALLAVAHAANIKSGDERCIIDTPVWKRTIIEATIPHRPGLRGDG